MLPFQIRKKRIRKRRTHSPEVIAKIVQLCTSGMRSKDIYKGSKDLFGYVIKQSSISNILHDNGLADQIRINSFVDPDKGKKPGWKRRLRELNEDPNKAKNDAILEKIRKESELEEQTEESEQNEEFEPDYEDYEEEEEENKK